MAPKYVAFKAPRYCPGASTLGYSTRWVKRGDLIKYREHYEPDEDGQERCGSRLARVLGLVAKGSGHAGNPPLSEDMLLVLAADDMLMFGYERWVALADIIECDGRQPGAFARWFLFGGMPPIQQALDMIQYGAMSDSYLAKYLDSPEGAPVSNWREVGRGKGYGEPK